MGKSLRSIGGYIALLISLIGLDQVTKLWALKNLSHSPRALFAGCNLVLAFNRGVSFGWLSFSDSGKYGLLITCIALIIIGLLWYTYRAYRRGVVIVAEVCILSGALSNLYDRIALGAVVDFIDLHVGSWHWYTFNIADMLLVGGAFLLVIRTIKTGE